MRELIFDNTRMSKNIGGNKHTLTLLVPSQVSTFYNWMEVAE